MQELGENFVKLDIIADEDLRPAPEAYGAISVGCGLQDGDLLSTAALELETYCPHNADLSPLGRQERCSSPSYSELLDVVTRAVDKLALDGRRTWHRHQSQSKLDDRFLIKSCTCSAP